MHGKEIPGVLLIFTVNARRFLNSSFLILHPPAGAHTVNTVGRHLKVPVKVSYTLKGRSAMQFRGSFRGYWVFSAINSVFN